MGIVPRFEIDENNNKILIMKKKLYQKPNIKVHEVPMDALLAASPGSDMNSVTKDSAIEDYPKGDGAVIDSKRGNLWGDDEE